MKLIFRMSSLLCLLATPALARVVQVNVAPSDVFRGVISQQIPLEHYGKPAVRVLSPVYTPVATLPEGVEPAPAEQLSVMPGMERKKSFAIVRIPAYRRTADGHFEMLSSFGLDIRRAAVKRRRRGQCRKNHRRHNASGNRHLVPHCRP